MSPTADLSGTSELPLDPQDDNDGRAGAAEEVEAASSQPGWRGRRASRGPTPELKQAADELAARVARGEAVTDQDVRTLQILGALDLIRSGRPTFRAKGLERLLELFGEQEGPEKPNLGAVDETSF